MSRIGKLPIRIPDGVKVGLNEGQISIEGPKGKLERTLPSNVEVLIDGNTVIVKRQNESQRSRSLHGLARTLINNMVTGVTEGFKKELSIVGVGYRAELKGNFLLFNLGYSHPILFELPTGVQAQVEKNTEVSLQGIDKEVVGQAAATIRSFRPPEPYKGKGIRYVGEEVRSKVGKSGV